MTINDRQCNDLQSNWRSIVVKAALASALPSNVLGYLWTLDSRSMLLGFLVVGHI